jgi:hypothetical protein
MEDNKDPTPAIDGQSDGSVQPPHLDTGPAPEETPDQVAERVIDAWKATMRNSPLTRHTASFNYLQGQLPVLSKLIAKEIKK